MSAGAGATSYQMADELYRQGLAQLVLNRPEEALWSFRSALKLFRSCNALPSWRCLSYFGLSLALTNGAAMPEAVRACESALKNDKYDGQLYVNLGRVYLLTGRRAKAIQTFERGVQMDGDLPELHQALREADRRTPPVLPMLSRSHPLNVYLGKRRARRERPHRG